MHYFHNLSSASEESPQTSTRIHPWTPLRDFRPQAPNLPTREKNHSGAHGVCMPYRSSFSPDCKKDSEKLCNTEI